MVIDDLALKVLRLIDKAGPYRHDHPKERAAALLSEGPWTEEMERCQEQLYHEGYLSLSDSRSANVGVQLLLGGHDHNVVGPKLYVSSSKGIAVLSKALDEKFDKQVNKANPQLKWGGKGQVTNVDNWDQFSDERDLIRFQNKKPGWGQKREFGVDKIKALMNDADMADFKRAAGLNQKNMAPVSPRVQRSQDVIPSTVRDYQAVTSTEALDHAAFAVMRDHLQAHLAFVFFTKKLGDEAALRGETPEGRRNVLWLMWDRVKAEGGRPEVRQACEAEAAEVVASIPGWTR